MTERDPFDAAYDELRDAVTAITEALERPKALYHFTTVSTLRKIIESGTLYASHAMALNDATETLLCLERARERVQARLVDASLDKSLGGWLSEFLAGSPLRTAEGEMTTSHLPCVACFCESVDFSEQWLHYGRAGCGVAIGFDASALQPKHVSLCKVNYDKNSQVAAIDKVIDTAARWRKEVGALRVQTLAHACCEFLKYLAPTMKHPSFLHEAEWRFMSTEVLVDGAPVISPEQGLQLQWREEGTRLVGYVQLPIQLETITEVVLGYSCATDVSAMRAYLSSKGMRTVVTRSEVPVRPAI